MSDALARAREVKREKAEERARLEREQQEIRVIELRQWLQLNPDARPGRRESMQMLLNTYERSLAVSAAEEQEVPEPTVQPKEQTKMQYYDIYPKEGHPSQVAPLVPGKATTMIETRHPIHAVMLDEGAFRVIWGIVEDQAMSRFDTRETKPASAALLRAVGSFRHSFVEQNGDGTVEATESGQDEPERPRKVRVKRIRNRQAVEEEVEIPRRRTMVRKPAEEVSTTELTRDAQRVLRVLKKAGVPLGKADVLAKAGLADEADWLPAIKDLLRTGLVTQTGLKRGAKYGVAK